jgi:hypothetical protein
MKELRNLNGDDAILERIRCADMEVASIELGKREHSFPVPLGFIPIGKQECDTLAIEDKTREIVLLDHEMQGRVIQHVAKNIESFVEALCVIENHFEECELNEDLYDDESFMERSATDAALRAGGEKYVNFYWGVFGI